MKYSLKLRYLILSSTILMIGIAGCATSFSPKMGQASDSQIEMPIPTALGPTEKPARLATQSLGISSELRTLASFQISATGTRYGNFSGFHPIAWSSDGTELAYTWKDAVWALAGPDLSPKKLVTIPNSELRGIYNSPNDSHFAIDGDQLIEDQRIKGNFVWSVNANGTELKNLTGSLNLPTRLTYMNSWSDNATVVFHVWAGNGIQRLYLGEVSNGEIRPLIENPLGCGAMGGNYFFSPDRLHLAIDSLQSQVAWTSINNLTECIKLTDVKFPLRQKFQAWLPDNNRFLYTEYANGDPDLGLHSSDVSLRLWDIKTNDFTKLLEGVAAAVPSPDGNLVAVLKQKNSPWIYAQEKGLNVNQFAGVTSLELGVLDLATKQVRMLGPAGYKQEENPDKTLRYWQLGRPAWSPDGSLIAYWGDDGNTYLVSADGSWRQQLTHGLDVVQFLWSPDGSKLALRTMDRAWIIENPKK